MLYILKIILNEQRNFNLDLSFHDESTMETTVRIRTQIPSTEKFDATARKILFSVSATNITVTNPLQIGE